MADEEETIEDSGGSEVQDSGVAVDEGADEAPASFGPAPKPKSDIFSLLLVITFAAFLTGTILVGHELHDFYKVNFWILK